MYRPDHDLADVFRRLGSGPLSRQTVGSVVADLAAAATPVLGADPAVSVTVLGDGPSRTVAASGPPALRLDAVQYREDAGPCLDAARRGGPVGTIDVDDARWPVFARALHESGYDSGWDHTLS